jgi:hypothetical protein
LPDPVLAIPRPKLVLLTVVLFSARELTLVLPEILVSNLVALVQMTWFSIDTRPPDAVFVSAQRRL